jgi:hypothetical protein
MGQYLDKIEWRVACWPVKKKLHILSLGYVLKNKCTLHYGE